MVKRLASLIPGESGTIAHVNGDAEVRNRLLEMGLTGGTRIEVIRVAPLGDPVEVQVRGYRLSFRRSEAAAVSINGA